MLIKGPNLNYANPLLRPSNATTTTTIICIATASIQISRYKQGSPLDVMVSPGV